MEIENMNCDYVQEQLSVFLDREEGFDETTLSHLYGCKDCQDFFSSAVKLRALANEGKLPYPDDLDDAIMRRAQRVRKTNPLSYRLNLPVYVLSTVAVVLLVVSFTFGFVMQEDIHQKQINAILQAPPAAVVYRMPTQLVYPALIREIKGGVK